ncbi:ornithine cyclodeaminase family protein [Brevibacterium luteolum]|uniref:ornithine cyclodeaminase family protein n=1 Tax=Brevibacterium luteolum TaxID=199591 RepID=UPI00223A7267|nr:hypothetical protein [Brevibacterium luteolum]MCT1828801.1 hypothetical protein [Brevibacterium luteolum]
MRIFTDADIRTHLTPRLAVDTMCAALAADGRDELACPPRLRAPLQAAGLDAGTLVITAGATTTHLGYRSYVRDRQLPGGAEEEQLVTAFNRETGALEAIAVGSLLGNRRTGALGGAAARYVAGDGPHRVALIGAGRQAAQQLWALRAVVGIEDVRIYAPTLKRRAELAEHAASSYGLTATAVETAEEAVREASIIVLATRATSPVIDTSWLAEDCLISTLGPAAASGSEIPDDLLTGACVFTDARDQHLAEPEALLPPGGAEAIIPLGQIANNEVRPRTDGRRVYLSRGLAGTEVALLTALADAVDG